MVKLEYDLYINWIKFFVMDKRIRGVVLTVIGIIGLILAVYNFFDSSGIHSKEIIIFGSIGLFFFLAGIGQSRTSGDKAI